MTYFIIVKNISLDQTHIHTWREGGKRERERSSSLQVKNSWELLFRYEKSFVVTFLRVFVLWMHSKLLADKSNMMHGTSFKILKGWRTEWDGL